MSSRILAGRYELMGKIGEGGMAVVFRARDKVLNRLVAVKILRPEYTKDEQFIESFRKESQLAAGIVDPNIVNVYDVGREGNIYYIVMELVEGMTLSDIIKKEGPLSARRAVSIARQIAMALSTAHRHNLIHRDVKPHNVLVTANDVAKIADFGIAKVVTSDTLVGEHKEAVMGSIHYFSPEQARGTGVGERSDIYSLGIVLYEMITGKVPFDGETAIEVAIKHMNEEMTPPSRLLPAIPQDVEDIIIKATKKNPDERYNTVDEMITDLSFVKFSKPSDYYTELEEKRAAGDISVGLDEMFAEKEEGDAQSTQGDIAGNKKGKKPLNRKKIITILLAIIIAIPISGILYNAFFNKEGKSDTVSVPNLVDMDYNEALEFIKDYELIIDIDLELNSDEFSIGRIISQTPSADNIVKRGSVIKVNVSKGPASVKVPNLVGQSIESAEARLEAYKFQLGNVREEHSNTFSKGMIISQEPVAGTVLSIGSKVDVKVSLGQKSTDSAIGGGAETENPNGDSEDSSWMVEIPSGSSGNKVGEILAEAGIVESKEVFVEKLKEMDYATKLRAGKYVIPKKATLEEIVKIIAGERF